MREVEVEGDDDNDSEVDKIKTARPRTTNSGTTSKRTREQQLKQDRQPNQQTEKRDARLRQGREAYERGTERGYIDTCKT